MPQYIDFYLSHNRYDKVIECLEDYCEKSDDFVEIEGSVKNLTDSITPIHCI